MNHKESAGLLMYRVREQAVQVLLVHPGGPYFAKKDAGYWSIPKGLIEDGEDALAAAQREFVEETSLPSRSAEYLPLGDARQKGGKRVQAWAFEGDCDPALIVSNTFELEWPPRSGRKQLFPENDRTDWFELPAALERINAAQAVFLERLVEHLQ
ncbi:MAG: NUDIX domain-containing protein [bacterium]|nr:NUDIX domain-containing protein [bacterium]